MELIVPLFVVIVLPIGGGYLFIKYILAPFVVSVAKGPRQWEIEWEFFQPDKAAAYRAEHPSVMSESVFQSWSNLTLSRCQAKDIKQMFDEGQKENPGCIAFFTVTQQ